MMMEVGPSGTSSARLQSRTDSAESKSCCKIQYRETRSHLLTKTDTGRPLKDDTCVVAFLLTFNFLKLLCWNESS